MYLVVKILCFSMLAMIGLSANGHMEFFTDSGEAHHCCSSNACSSEQAPSEDSESENALCNPLDGCPNCMVFIEAQVLLPFQTKPSILSQDWIYNAEQAIAFYTSDDPPPKG